jgi:hypothetical protein
MNFSFDDGAPHPSLAQERGRDPPSPRRGEGEEKHMLIIPQLIYMVYNQKEKFDVEKISNRACHVASRRCFITSTGGSKCQNKEQWRKR